MVAVQCSQGFQHRLSREDFQRRRGVDDSAVKENPPRVALGRFSVSQRHRDCLACKGQGVKPGERASAGFEFILHNPTPRLFDDRVAAGAKLGEQG